MTSHNASLGPSMNLTPGLNSMVNKVVSDLQADWPVIALCIAGLVAVSYLVIRLEKWSNEKQRDRRLGANELTDEERRELRAQDRQEAFDQLDMWDSILDAQIEEWNQQMIAEQTIVTIASWDELDSSEPGWQWIGDETSLPDSAMSDEARDPFSIGRDFDITEADPFAIQTLPRVVHDDPEDDDQEDED